MRESGIAAALAKPVRQPQLLVTLTEVLSKQSDGDRATRRLTQTGNPPPLLQAVTGRPRVLVAEDNPVNQRVAVRMLERLGLGADVAADGREAVQSFHRQPYAAILMDCQMPVLDGYEASIAIRQREATATPPAPRVPIVALTAAAMPGDRERCLAAGMDDYVSKPMTLERLAETLRRWVPGRISVPMSPRLTATVYQTDDVGEPALDASVLAQLADENHGVTGRSWSS